MALSSSHNLRTIILGVALIHPCLAVGQPASSASPSPIASATVSRDALSPPDNNERQELAEYRLAERVETRVVTDLRVYGAIFGVALTIIGFIGFAAIRDIVARHVEKDITAAIEKDVESFRSKIQTTLIDAQVFLAETKRVGADIQKQVESLQSKHAELEDLSERFETLHKSGLEISHKVENALAVAAESARQSNNLRQVVASSFAGNPAIVGGSYGWFADSPFVINGSNFGERPGKVRVLVYAHLETDPIGPGFSVARWKMPEIEIHSDEIEKWTDNEIRFRLNGTIFDETREFQKKVTAEKVARGLNAVAFSYETKVETADGRLAISYEPPLKPL